MELGETDKITVDLQLTLLIFLPGRTTAEGLFGKLPWDLWQELAWRRV